MVGRKGTDTKRDMELNTELDTEPDTEPDWKVTSRNTSFYWSTPLNKYLVTLIVGHQRTLASTEGKEGVMTRIDKVLIQQVCHLTTWMRKEKGAQWYKIWKSAIQGYWYKATFYFFFKLRTRGVKKKFTFLNSYRHILLLYYFSHFLPNVQ